MNKPEKMTEEEILAELGKGYMCSQVVVRRYAEALGLDKDLLTRLTSTCGGGHEQGGTCGAIVATGMLLGYKYGYADGSEADKRNDVKARCFKVTEGLREQRGSVLCKDLLGGRLFKEDFDGTMAESLRVCPAIIREVFDMLDEVLFDEE